MKNALANKIANRLQEVYLNGTLIANTNYKVELENVDMKIATTKVHNLNTIADLTYHINYYLQGLIPVFDGEDLTIRDKYSFDAPPITTESDWQNLKNTMLENAQTFIHKVRNLTDEDLFSIFVKEQYGDYYRNLEVVVEHSYYHLGQITIIKKMITNPS